MTTNNAEIKRELEAGAGRIRITTVHASKGLEAPVVILPDTTTLPHVQNMPRWQWHPARAAFDPHDEPFESGSVPFHLSTKPSHPVLLTLYDRARTLQIEEYHRLLYVAMTRAADRLVVCGCATKADEATPGSWYDLIRTALMPLHNPLTPPADACVAPDIVITDPLLVPPSHTDSQPTLPLHEPPPPLPVWATARPADDPKPPRPLIPSRPDEEGPPSASPRDTRMAWGTLAHKLLQYLPDIAPSARRDTARRFLANPSLRLSTDEQTQLANEVMNVLEHPDFAPLFAQGSLAEVPVTGLIENRVISGQIDRLCITGNEVWIVDYKTNRAPPDHADAIPAAYKRQMAAYRTVLSRIYPQHTIRCFLAWTMTLRIINVDHLLD